MLLWGVCLFLWKLAFPLVLPKRPLPWKKMQDSKIEALIDEYKKYEILWNPNHNHYTDKRMRYATLETISNKLGDEWNGNIFVIFPIFNLLFIFIWNFSVSKVLKKIHSLRTQYKAEVTKENRATKTGVNYKSKWKFYNSMSSLYIESTAPNRRKNTPTSNTVDNNKEILIGQTNRSLPIDDYLNTSLISASPTPSLTIDNDVRIKFDNEDKLQTIWKIQDPNSSYCDSYNSNTTTPLPQISGLQSWCLSLESSLKLFDPLTLEQTKIQIHQLIFEKLKELYSTTETFQK